MTLFIDGELYVCSSANSPHNGEYCAGPSIYHHIKKTGYRSEPHKSLYDPFFKPTCGTGRSSNFTTGWEVRPASTLPTDSRLCRICAKKLAEGDSERVYEDSIFDIPDYRRPTQDGHPVRYARQYTRSWGGGSGLHVKCDVRNGELVPVRILLESTNDGWERVDVELDDQRRRTVRVGL